MVVVSAAFHFDGRPDSKRLADGLVLAHYPQGPFAVVTTVWQLEKGSGVESRPGCTHLKCRLPRAGRKPIAKAHIEAAPKVRRRDSRPVELVLEPCDHADTLGQRAARRASDRRGQDAASGHGRRQTPTKFRRAGSTYVVRISDFAAREAGISNREWPKSGAPVRRTAINLTEIPVESLTCSECSRRTVRRCLLPPPR